MSESTRQLALKHYAREIGVIPNGVDVARWRPTGIRVQEPPRIVFAGRLVEQKNPIQIVHTLAELKDLSWQCVMIGDGSLLPEVQRTIVEHGLQERITLTGWITPEAVLDWFDKSDILFMPSLSEGFPVVGVQALAKGLAFVVSNIGGFVDIVGDGENGCLVDFSQPDNFSAVLRQFLSDRTQLERFRNASLKRAARFDIVHIAEQYEEIFLEVQK